MSDLRKKAEEAIEISKRTKQGNWHGEFIAMVYAILDVADAIRDSKRKYRRSRIH